MNEAQVLWYAQSIGVEKEDKYKYDLGMSEYLASFWNAEAVQKIRSQREMEDDERFASDEEFSKQIEDRDFLNVDPLIQEIKDKYKNTNLPSNKRERERTVKSPEDMSGLFRITKKR
jgi:hypothetical protein